MDKKLGDICEFSDSLIRSIDQALWKNFIIEGKNYHPCSVINGPDNNYACVSKDVLQHFTSPLKHDLPVDYSDMNYDQIQSIFTDFDPLNHWEEIKGMVSVTDHHVLRFILRMNIPIEKFIRYELASCGLNENGEWCGFEKAKEIWMTE